MTVTLVVILVALGLGVTVVALAEILTYRRETHLRGELSIALAAAHRARSEVAALEEKFMAALKRGIDAQNTVHNEQGKLAIIVAARLASIETLLAHSRKGHAAQLKSLYARAKAELERQSEDAQAARAQAQKTPEQMLAKQAIDASNLIAEATQFGEEAGPTELGDVEALEDHGAPGH